MLYRLAHFDLKGNEKLLTFYFFMNIYVANIPYKATSEELKELFEEFGEVISAKIIMDRYTQRSKGFGFVEMKEDADGQQAIESLNGKDFMGKNIVVNEARPKTDNGNSFNNNRRSGGSNSGGNYNKKPYKSY